LIRFASIPNDRLHDVVNAHGLRAERTDTDVALACENAEQALRVLAAGPDDSTAHT
jgi:hypothetical protein